MKLIDANLLLLSYDANASLHKPATAWLEATLSGRELVGIPMLCIAAFLRINTDKRLARLPMRMADAIATVESWMALDHVRVLHTADTTWPLTVGFLHDNRLSGADVTDAQLAALAVEHGAVLYSNDRDFARYRDLRWVDPLAKRS